MRVRGFALLIGILHPVLLTAQVPAGAEFQVSSGTTIVGRSTVAIDPGGGFIVVWDEFQPFELRARRFDADGSPLGAAFAVNTPTSDIPRGPVAAALGRGRTVVAWTQMPNGGGPFRVHARLFDHTGVPAGPEFMAHPWTTISNAYPSVAALSGGGFVVAWGAGGYGYGGVIAGRRFDGAGNGLGPVFRVTTYTTGAPITPSVAADDSGRFVVVWREQTSGDDIFARRFDAAGAPLGSEFRVNVYTTGTQSAPRVTRGAEGDFTVVWSQGVLIDVVAVMGRRFDPDGAPVGTDFVVQPFPGPTYTHTSLTSDRTGEFIVTWDAPDANSFDVLARRFTAAGDPRGAVFRVNTYTSGLQMFPSVATDGSGNFVVAWKSEPPASSQAIYGQRYGGLRPASAVVDPFGTSSDGNTVLEPGESVAFRPAWRNDSEAPISFSAAITQFTGPAGATYGIVDASSTYPTLNPGVTGTGDGFELSVSAPAVRPAAHWDAVATESISPDEQGQRKRWTLHVGDSFTDVARSSPFYVFIETLLHHGVTGGCGGSDYCPSNSTSREQMAPFVLVAKEGAGYAPPACTTPLFADVPASSPFCRWIEELARRGVVSGCGGGNYCPGESVTREQMAVFVLRTLDPLLNPPACTTPMFADVPASSPFCRWIEELARRGVVTGCGGGNYCPTQPVTREQMTVFLTATFGLTLYGP